MLKLLSIVSIIAQCYASYGYTFGGGGNNLGYANSGGIIPAAVKSIWRLDVRPVHLPQEPIQPQTIVIPPLELPVKILYHSKSSGVFVQQIHTPGEPGQAEATKSEEEPHKLSHEVVRPVIQELREVIIPYRRVVQEIAPVVEEVQTIVARGEGRQNAVMSQGGGVLPSISTGSSAGGVGTGGGLGSLYGSSGGSSLIGLKGSGLGGYGAKSIPLGALDNSSSSSKSSAAKKA